MKFTSVTPRHARTSYTVELTSDEQTYSDYRLVTMADRGGRLTDEEWTAIKEAGVHPGHFGGEVRRFEDGTANIDVYTD